MNFTQSLGTLSQTVCRELSDKRLNASKDWIKACVQWCRSEGGLTNTSAISKACYDQWLITDIRQSGVQDAFTKRQFPMPEIRSEVKFTLPPGSYVVQVLQAYDIGQAAYSQLQKLKKVKDENNSVSAEDDTHHRYMGAWEPKPKRVLKMHLTNGSQIITAIEQESLSCLSSPVKPGLKLILVGPITCRRGVLMLKADNVKILGGPVGEMSQEFSLKNQLSALIGKGTGEDSSTGIIKDEEVVEHPVQRFIPKGIPIKYKGNKLQPPKVSKSFSSNQRLPLSNFQPRNTPQATTLPHVDDFDDNGDDLLANMELPGDEDVFNDEDDELFSQIDLGTPSTSDNKKRKIR